jgi:uncharacterized membrane protein
MRSRFLLLLAVLTAAFARPSGVAARSLVIESFRADIQVNADGTIEVTETICPHFYGSWNGIYRTIPVRYRTPQGFNYTLALDIQSITDEEGSALTYESNRKGNYRKFKIWVPNASDATRTVVLTYRVRNGLRFFDEHDELYWNITGDEWEIPIQAASARIALPSGVEGLRAVAFTGGYGSTEQAAKIEIEKEAVNFQSLRPLNFREGLTVAVGWNPGLVRRPTLLELFLSFLRSNLIFVIPLIAFAGMFWLWYNRGRDPRLRPVYPRYEPPEDMSPAEMGALTDNSADMRDVTATLVDLAVRGYVLIEEKEKEYLIGLWSKKDYTFVLRKKESEWGDLKPHERALLDAMFLGGAQESVELSDLENKFYTSLPGIRDRIFGRLIGHGCYTSRPDRVKRGYLIGAGAIAFLSFFGATIGTTLGLAPAGTFAAGFLTALIVGAFGWFMPARTLAGAHALEGVLGFEEFLNRVESHRFEQVIKSPELFEKYLPHAMALGVEKNWAKAFEDIYRQPPEWYHGGSFGAFSTGSFVSSMGHMSSQAASVMSSAPRSSGGSGFGGGGSSGGGGGGGGGGGF